MVARGTAKRPLLRSQRYSPTRYDGVMTFPATEFLSTTSEITDTDVVVVGLRKTDAGPVVHAPGMGADTLRELTQIAASIQAEGAADNTWRHSSPASLPAASIVFTGLGPADISADSLRAAAGFATLSIQKSERVVFVLAEHGEQLSAVIEGALLGAHRVAKTGKEPERAAHRLAFLGSAPAEELERVAAGALAVWRVRDLVSMPPNFLNPASFVDHVTSLLKGSTVQSEVLEEQALRDQGFGGITAVGKGSQNPPRLMILRYTPTNPSRHIALVGKGITFDSGGLSLKAPNAMVGMKYDMTGAAAMAAVTLAAAALGGPAAITAYLCLAENMPSGSASRPNDVITIKGGKTVEILNTDAEGRLVMADGLQLASAEKPDLIIDIATLTGAARIALGERYAGLMGSDSAVAEVSEAARKTGEKVWAMPLPSELRSLLNSDVADIANAKPGEVLGGMLLAGVFLQEFVGEGIPWAHLDVAGPANNSQGAFGYTPKGASGALTRSILEVVLS